MKQTAVDFIIDYFENPHLYKDSKWIDIKLQAKEMEREQMASNCSKLTNKDIKNKIHQLTEQWFFENGVATDEGKQFDAVEFKKRMSWNLGFWSGAEWCREQLNKKQCTASH